MKDILEGQLLKRNQKGIIIKIHKIFEQTDTIFKADVYFLFKTGTGDYHKINKDPFMLKIHDDDFSYWEEVII